MGFHGGLAGGAGEGVGGEALSRADLADTGEHVVEESADVFLFDGGGDRVQFDRVASEGLDLEPDVLEFVQVAGDVRHVGGRQLDGDRHQEFLRERAVDAVQDALEEDAFVRRVLVDQHESAGDRRHDVGVFQHAEQTQSGAAEIGRGGVLRHETEIGTRLVFGRIRLLFGRDRQFGVL